MSQVVGLFCQEGEDYYDFAFYYIDGLFYVIANQFLIVSEPSNHYLVYAYFKLMIKTISI